MSKTVKIAIVSVVAVVAVIVVVLFVVLPLTTSKEAEMKLDEALTEAGIPEDMWSVDKAYYVPLLGHLVVENLKFGEKGGAAILQVKKVTLAQDTGNADLFAGSVDAQDLSFLADDAGVTVKTLSVKDFSVDKALFKQSPFEAIKKFGNFSLSDAVFSQKGRMYFSAGTVSANVGYVEGKIPLSSSVLLKELVVDARQFTQLPVLRSEYRLSTLELKNSVSGGAYTINLSIDGANLFTIKAALGLSLPPDFLASGDITHLARIDYEKDVKLDTFVLTYTDKSFLDHVFELAGISGGRESIAEQFSETLPLFAMMSNAEAERFHGEVTKFIAKPGMLELKTISDTPVSLYDISRNPLAMNISLSINGGKPFTTAGQ